MSDQEIKNFIAKINHLIEDDLGLKMMDNSDTVPMMNFKTAIGMVKVAKLESEFYIKKIAAKDREIAMLREEVANDIKFLQQQFGMMEWAQDDEAKTTIFNKYGLKGLYD